MIVNKDANSMLFSFSPYDSPDIQKKKSFIFLKGLYH